MAPQVKKLAIVSVTAVVLVFLLLFSSNSQEDSIISPNTEASFQSFLTEHGKVYRGDEYYLRLETYAKNLELIRMHNEQSRNVILAMNWLADLTDEEYSQLLSAPEIGGAEPAVYLPTADLPESVDWVQRGAVTTVKDQKACGACYAFAGVATIESAHFLRTAQLISLSEQEVVDCSKITGNRGCHGGKPQSVFRYAQKHGITTSHEYPYKGFDHQCYEDYAVEKVWITDYATVPHYDQLQLKAAVAQQPVAVAIQADQKLFQFYRSGVLGEDCGSRLTHAVVIVGYGGNSVEGEFWVAKNSWGKGWGEQGFVRIQREDQATSAGACGITLDPSYPII